MGNPPPSLVPVNCNSCGKKIGEMKIKEGVVSIVCPKCGTNNTFEAKPTKTERVQNASR